MTRSKHMRSANTCQVIAVVSLTVAVLAGAKVMEPGTSLWAPIVLGVASLLAVRYTVAAAAIMTAVALDSALRDVAERNGAELDD